MTAVDAHDAGQLFDGENVRERRRCRPRRIPREPSSRGPPSPRASRGSRAGRLPFFSRSATPGAISASANSRTASRIAALVFGQLEVHCAPGGVGRRRHAGHRARLRLPRRDPGGGGGTGGAIRAAAPRRAARAAGPGPAPCADCGRPRRLRRPCGGAGRGPPATSPARPLRARPGAPPRSGGRPGLPRVAGDAGAAARASAPACPPAFFEMAERHHDLRADSRARGGTRRSSRAAPRTAPRRSREGAPRRRAPSASSSRSFGGRRRPRAP